MAEFEDAAEDLEKLNLEHKNKNNSNESCENRSPVTDNETGGAGSSDEEYHTDEGEEPQSDSEEPKAKTKDEIKAEELRLREEKEINLTEDERVELRDKGQQLKESGNTKFKQQLYSESIDDYTEALSVCPLCYKKERAIMYSNRAAAHVYLSETDAVIADCTEAIELHPHYPKPLLRRAQAYEKSDKLDEALEDYKKLLELDARNVEALSACQRLPAQINERNEKLKTEMFGKLKDLGNLVLKPFGMSTDNFQLQQNDGGGYSVNFKQS